MGPACSQQTAVVPILSGVVQKIIGDLFDDRYSNEYPSAENCEFPPHLMHLMRILPPSQASHSIL